MTFPYALEDYNMQMADEYYDDLEIDLAYDIYENITDEEIQDIMDILDLDGTFDDNSEEIINYILDHLEQYATNIDEEP